MSRNKWYQQSGAEGDVVISTRVRLARNLHKVPFPASMTAEQRKQVADRAAGAAVKLEESIGKLHFLQMEGMPQREALSMAERHLISPEFSRCEEGSALLLSEDESVSIMVNEEDHFRIQVMCPGLDLDAAYQKADALDTALDGELQFAFDDRLGYLTQCPTNLGTGMRASIMLHLPALEERGMLQQRWPSWDSPSGAFMARGANRRGLFTSSPTRSRWAYPSRPPLKISRA